MDDSWLVMIAERKYRFNSLSRPALSFLEKTQEQLQPFSCSDMARLDPTLPGPISEKEYGFIVMK
jgi:hypothetical protein